MKYLLRDTGLVIQIKSHTMVLKDFTMSSLFPFIVEYEIYWRVISSKVPKKLFKISPFFKIELV